MIQTLEPILREHPFFHGMEDQHVRLIAGCSKNVRFGEGQVIFREGDPADHFYLIREGLVSVQFVIPHDGLTTMLTVGGGALSRANTSLLENGELVTYLARTSH